MIPTLVTIRNGIVDQVVICEDGKELEDRFVAENRAFGRETNAEEMDEGYVELEEVTICMCWATSEYIDRDTNVI